LKEEVVSLRHTLHSAVSSKAETTDLVALTEALHQKASKDSIHQMFEELSNSILTK